MVIKKITELYPSVVGYKDRIIIANRVDSSLSDPLADDKGSMTLLEKLKESNKILKTAHLKDKRVSTFTAILGEIVTVRSDEILYIRDIIKTHVKCPHDLAIKNEAKKLKIELAHTLKSNKVRTQSGGSIAAEEIVRVCAKKKNKEAVKTLGLEIPLAKLAEFQTKFSETFKTKVSTEQAKRGMSISKASSQLFDSIISLFNRVSSQNIILKGAYNKAIKTINEIIEHEVRIARGRKTRSTGKGEEEIEANLAVDVEQEPMN